MGAPAAAELFSVDGKVALVTGGSRGIGFMIAAALVRGGARVYVASRDPERGERAARELAGLAPGARCAALSCDLAAASGPEELAAALAEREPALHVLVNNAAVQRSRSFAEHGAADFDEAFALHARAPFLLVQHLLPCLEAAASPEDPARVVNVGSADAIRLPYLETYAYSASKAALHQLTRHLARRLGRRHVTVNAVAPGPFATDMTRPVMEELGPGAMERGTRLGRLGTAEDVAGATLYLCSRAGAFVTGAVLPVDGGMSLA